MSIAPFDILTFIDLINVYHPTWHKNRREQVGLATSFAGGADSWKCQMQSNAVVKISNSAMSIFSPVKSLTRNDSKAFDQNLNYTLWNLKFSFVNTEIRVAYRYQKEWHISMCDSKSIHYIHTKGFFTEIECNRK